MSPNHRRMADASRRDLPVRTVLAVGAGTAGAVEPVLGAAATALSPALEAHCPKSPTRSAAAAPGTQPTRCSMPQQRVGARTDEEFLEFVEQAISDERKQDLLARALLIAQDPHHGTSGGRSAWRSPQARQMAGR